MTSVGFTNPTVNGYGRYIPPQPQLLSINSKLGQLVVYYNYIGIVTEISHDYIKINTKYDPKCCSVLTNSQPIEIKDSIIVGKKIIIH